MWKREFQILHKVEELNHLGKENDTHTCLKKNYVGTEHTGTLGSYIKIYSMNNSYTIGERYEN